MHDTAATTPTPTEYEPPRLETLGTLADLTLGGGADDADMTGQMENSNGPT